jgi:hypothetical protein
MMAGAIVPPLPLILRQSRGSDDSLSRKSSHRVTVTTSDRREGRPRPAGASVNSCGRTEPFCYCSDNQTVLLPLQVSSAFLLSLQ